MPLPPPRALLLDFGGVIADGPIDPDWDLVVVETIAEVLAAAGAPPLPPERIRASLAAERTESERFWLAEAPTQPDHASFWGELVAGDWPAPARAAVIAQAPALSYRYMDAWLRDWQPRPGMPELLADAEAHGLPVAIVSNTLCGEPHRQFLDRVGLTGRFAVQLYSDEHGIRKPNPAFARRAVTALGVPAEACWFVGDTLSRDILVARRAGLGAAILMRSLRAEPDPGLAAVVQPDAVVADPVELHALLKVHRVDSPVADSR
ncbi:MAG TPA: HAD family hydrolase [Natronosporangium sp.]